MSGQNRALLLIGSGKPVHSNSESLGGYLLSGLARRGFQTRPLKIPHTLRAPGGAAAITEAVRQASLVVLATPLYWDSLPAAVIEAMEAVAEDRRNRPPENRQRLVAILNSGFPEARQSDTALAICRRFAKETGFEWAGGLAMGAGGAVAERPLDQAGRRVRHVARALDLAAEALARGESVPEATVRLMAKPILPAWAFVLYGRWLWPRWARRFGAQKRLRDKPYAA
jgi:hypothetical protein